MTKNLLLSFLLYAHYYEIQTITNNYISRKKKCFQVTFQKLM